MNLKPEEVFLAQGTLRPDLIESASHLASGKADVIKTHHNDTELIRKLRDEVGPLLGPGGRPDPGGCPDPVSRSPGKGHRASEGLPQG